MNAEILAKGLVTLLAKRCAGPFWLRSRQLAATQWWSGQELKALQLELLQRLVRYCYRWVPYYRTLMNERGIRPEQIESLEDIERFPVLTKKDALQAGDLLVSEGPRGWVGRPAYTGGTTGTPMRLCRDLFSIGNEHAFVRRQWSWAGIGLRDRCAFLTGRLVAKADQTERLHAYDPFMKELVLSTYHLSHDTARQYAKLINEYRVKAVAGYPSAVYLLAQVCLESGLEVRLRAALTSSETLTDSMRERITEAFHCPVFDFYGSAERVCYIFTCERGSYHVIPEYGLTELIPIDAADPDRCRVISTGFWNKAMPFIRYDMGDIVIRSNQSCPCGRAFPAIRRIEGRQSDGIVTPSGRQLGAALLTHLLYGTGNILESQIIQDALDHITIEYVPAPQFSEQDMRAFRGLIEKHLPSELRADFRKVDAVQRTESGKIRPVVSRL